MFAMPFLAVRREPLWVAYHWGCAWLRQLGCNRFQELGNS